MRPIPVLAAIVMAAVILPTAASANPFTRVCNAHGCYTTDAVAVVAKARQQIVFCRAMGKMTAAHSQTVGGNSFSTGAGVSDGCPSQPDNRSDAEIAANYAKWVAYCEPTLSQPNDLGIQHYIYAHKGCEFGVTGPERISAR